MLKRSQVRRSRTLSSRSAGFSLIELMVSSVILVSVSAIVVSGTRQMSFAQNTVQNRTEMHSSVRSATELMQQEVGQAGRVTLMTAASLTSAGCTSTSYTLTAAVAAAGSASPTVSCVNGMFLGEQIVVDTGSNQETVTLTNLVSSPASITATFANTHASGAPISVAGAFASGVVPTTATNGSTGNVLKIYGDINDDGNMVYVEYTCDTSTDANGGNLYRNVVSLSASSKPAVTSSMILLPNVTENGAACFTYQQQTIGVDTYVTDVAITLTTQTEYADLQTGSYGTETKALLNVSPRNVFEVWEMASAGITNRIQPMPVSPYNGVTSPYNVSALLP